jgi:flagellar assembly factor FliW
MTPAYAERAAEVSADAAEGLRELPPQHARDVISFPAGLPGFEACRAFVLLAPSESAPIQRLDSVSGPKASFLVVDRRMLPPTYRFELSEADRARLGAADDTTLLWLALLMVEPDGTIAVNLRAPIVINPERMVGYQVMPHDCLFPLRHVLAEAEGMEVGSRQ